MTSPPASGTIASVVPWLLRGLWVALPFSAGTALASALDGLSAPVRTVASAGLWLGWAFGMAATVVAHPLGLTAVRLLAPAAVVAATVAATSGSTTTSESSLAIVWTSMATAWAFMPTIGAKWVNGPAYPNERRYLLRPPGRLLAGPLILAWAMTLVSMSAGPLLLAAEQWVVGGIALGAGMPLAWLLVRSMHNLSRRWAVFVPAGMVLHDPLTLVDPVLLARRDVASLAPATARGDSIDLGQGAPGLALEMSLRSEASFTLMTPGKREGRSVTTTRFLFTPTRPGEVLDEARRRRLPAG